MAKYIFPYLTLPYLTRVLEPDAYAVRAYILAAMTFMQVFLDYGFNSYGTKVVAESINDEGLIHRVTSSIALLRIMLAVVGAIALLPVTSSIPIMGANPCYVAIAYLGVCFKAMLPDFIFQGKEDMGIITKRFVVSQAVATFLIFATVRAPSDLLWVPVIEALASFIALAWSWANALTVQGIRLVRPVTKELAYLFRQASIFFLSGASTTVFTALTTLMIGVFIVDQVEIAYWSVAMTAVNAIQSLYTPITNSLYPHMVKCKDFALVKKLLIVGMPVVFRRVGLVRPLIQRSDVGTWGRAVFSRIVCDISRIACSALFFSRHALGLSGARGNWPRARTDDVIRHFGFLSYCRIVRLGFHGAVFDSRCSRAACMHRNAPIDYSWRIRN